MKELAIISALLCIAVIAVVAAPRTAVPTSHDGLGDSDRGTLEHRASIIVPSRPADFQYGLTGTGWWTAHKVAHAAN